MLSVHGGIYLNVQDYKTKTENKMHVDIEYKCKKMAAVSLSTFSHLADRNWVGDILSAVSMAEILQELFICSK